MENKYTIKDVTLLLHLITSKIDGGEGRASDRVYICGKTYTTGEDPTDFLKAMVFETIRLNIAKFPLEKGKEFIDMYKFVFEEPLENVPFYINHEILNKCGLVEWRLKIGK